LAATYGAIRIRDHTGDRSGVDDGAACSGNHGGNLGLEGEEHSLEVDIDRAVPVSFGLLE
jgi:hypothetical protein